MGIDASSKDGATIVIVEETFDEVIEKFWPLQPAGSNLEARTNNIFHTHPDGKRVMVKTPSIVLIEEEYEDE